MWTTPGTKRQLHSVPESSAGDGSSGPPIRRCLKELTSVSRRHDKRKSGRWVAKTVGATQRPLDCAPMLAHRSADARLASDVGQSQWAL